MKDQPIGDYSIEVASLSDSFNFSKEVKLNMNTKTDSIFIQTDKSIYKPSDKVNFRLIVLNEEMKPRENIKVDIFISDGADNRIKKYDDVKFYKGVFESFFILSDLPVMGIWNIHVNVNEVKELSKSFEVKEYVLPKFETHIKAPDVNFKDGKIFAYVSAKYTFGKIAHGNATITAEVVNNRWYWRHPNNQNQSKKVVKVIEVNGKKPVEFDIENELGIVDKSYETKVNLFSTFREQLTDREMNASTTVTVHKTAYNIELAKSSERFKPGLKFSVSCFVTNQIQKTPVQDEENPLEVYITYFYDVLKNCTHDHYYYPYNSGSSNNEKYQRICRDEKSYIENHNVTLKNGHHDFQVELPSNISRIDFRAKYKDSENTLYYITKAETENNQYIQIEKQIGK